MNAEAKNIPVNTDTMKAEIDANDYKVVYIIDKEGKVESIPLPKFGVLEIPCQNYSIGNLTYKVTLKRQ